MRQVQHWRESRTITLARSRSGVSVTTHPHDNLVRGAADPWPTPELLQKFNASGQLRGATPADDAAARSGLGYYCDLQSLNSEDALTWNVFGCLDRLPDEERTATVHRLFQRMQLPQPSGPITIWLWRRLPHPEKPESNGGPEIDFGFLTRDTLVLGESKWNSPLGKGQGVNKDRSQLFLRLACCNGIARRAFPKIQRFVVLGIAPSPDLLAREAESLEGVEICDLTWAETIDCFDGELREELLQYLAWRAAYARSA